MVMTCSVRLCPYKSLKISTFGVPKAIPLRLEWEKALSTKFKDRSRVCRNHFKSEDITDTWVSGQGFSKYTITLKRPKLRAGAIPIQFQSSEISQLSTCIESNLVQKDTNEYNGNITNNNDKQIEDNLLQSNNIIDSTKVPEIISSIQKDHCYILINEKSELQENITHDLLENNLSNEALPLPKKTKIRHSTNTTFIEILNKVNILNIPQKWSHNKDRVNTILVLAFYKLGTFKENFTRAIEKQLILTEENQLLLYIYGKKIEISEIGYSLDTQVETYNDLENIIKKFDEVQVCHGSISCHSNDIQSIYGHQCVESFGMWRHVKCSTILTNDNSRERNVCIWCKRLYYMIKNRQLREKRNKNTRIFFSPIQKESLQKLINKNNLLKKKCSRAAKRIDYLQNSLNSMKDQMTKISKSKLENKTLQKTKWTLNFSI